MGQILHGSATTTHAIRAAIQRSKATAKELAERHGLNPKTVAKWKKRTFVHDAPMGPKDPRSTVLSVEEEAIAVAFRKHTLLAARRLSLCPAGHHPASDPLFPASLLSAPRHQPAAGRAKATSLPRRRSRPIPSAISTSILPRSEPKKASSISSWPLTGRQNLPSPNSMRRQHGPWLRISCEP